VNSSTAAAAAIIERVADPDIMEPIRPTVEELQRLTGWGGEVEPEDAVAYLSALPTGLQPTTVGHRGDFTPGPAPR